MSNRYKTQAKRLLDDEEIYMDRIAGFAFSTVDAGATLP